MSKQARTVKELLTSMEKHTVAAHKEVTKDDPERLARNEGFWMGYAMAHSKLNPILDAYIIPGANAIVSAEGLEAATRVFAKWALPNDLLWGEMNEAAKEQARLITVKVLEAAGIRIEAATDE